MAHTAVRIENFAGVQARVYKYADCASTNEEAAQLVSAEQSVVVVQSEYQSAGRGRRSNTWLGERAVNLYMSIALYEDRWSQHISDYQLLPCYAVLMVLRRLQPTHAFHLKYPNDVIALEKGVRKKLSGVLVETEFHASQMQQCVCGIGVNLLQQDFDAELQQRATSLQRVAGTSPQPDEVMMLIAEEFFKLKSTTPDTIFNQWKHELDIIGKEISMNDQSEYYSVVDVARDARLVLRDKEGIQMQVDPGTNYHFRTRTHLAEDVKQ